MRWARVITPWAIVAQVGGCSGSEGRQTSPAATVRTSGVILVTIRASASDVGVSTEARLLSMRDVNARAAHLLAGARPGPDAELPRGACRITLLEQAYDEALASIGPDAEVKKLDAGELRVEVAGRWTRLAPILRPEVTTLIEGVTYEPEPDVGGWAQVPTGQVAVRAPGGEDMLGFAVDVAIPEEPVLLVDPIAPEVVADAGSDLDVWWVPPTQARGEVEIVVSWSHEGGGELRCRAPDDGFFSIPRRVVAAIEGPGRYTLEVDRGARTVFRVPGLENGWLEVRVVSARPLRWH